MKQKYVLVADDFLGTELAVIERNEKMQKYRVHVTEASHGFIIVEANCEYQARKIAEDEYHNGNTMWMSGSHTIHSAEAEPT